MISIANLNPHLTLLSEEEKKKKKPISHTIHKQFTYWQLWAMILHILTILSQNHFINPLRTHCPHLGAQPSIIVWASSSTCLHKFSITYQNPHSLIFNRSTFAILICLQIIENPTEQLSCKARLSTSLGFRPWPKRHCRCHFHFYSQWSFSICLKRIWLYMLKRL